jgi:hypothetical protein
MLNPATVKQVSFIAKLAAERGIPAPKVATTSDASAAIKNLLATPKSPANVSKIISDDQKPVEIGIYRNDAGEIFKVQKSKQTEGLYAMKLTPIGGQRLSEAGEKVQWKFVYAKGAIRTLTASNRLTLEAAKAFGIQYGVCVVCGRTLVDADSVAAGIGPVCAKKF